MSTYPPKWSSGCVSQHPAPHPLSRDSCHAAPSPARGGNARVHSRTLTALPPTLPSDLLLHTPSLHATLLHATLVAAHHQREQWAEGEAGARYRGRAAMLPLVLLRRVGSSLADAEYEGAWHAISVFAALSGVHLSKIEVNVNT